MNIKNNSKLRVVYLLDFYSKPQYFPVSNIQEAFTLADALMKTTKLVAQKAELVQKTTIINLEQYNTISNDWEFWLDENGKDITDYVNLRN